MPFVSVQLTTKTEPTLSDSLVLDKTRYQRNAVVQLEGPGESETNHGIHRHTQKREFGLALPFRVLPCVPWLPVGDDLSCWSNINDSLFSLTVGGAGIRGTKNGRGDAPC